MTWNGDRGLGDWFNYQLLHGSIGFVPPVEYESAYYMQRPAA